jgi:uncharacterized protein DUF5941
MNAFVLSRDDGPLARALAPLGAAVRLPAAVLPAIGAVPLFTVMAVDGADASNALVGLVLAWVVLTGGASRGRPHDDPLRWAVAPALRLVEYASIIWLGAIAGGSGPAAAFALLAAVAFHHYDLFYRPRFFGAPPPSWVGDVAGGWEGRLLGTYVLLLAGALPAGLFAAAGVLGVMFAAESALSWSHAREAGFAPGYVDEGGGEE